jgi:hypothetical protein
MAETEEAPKDNILLIAQVRANLLTGGVIDLLPFKHENDVRAEVNKFIEDWVKTGFLLKENFLYPWHQVKNVEVVWVKTFTKAEAKPYLDVWQLDTEAQKSFWKTRKPAGKQDEEKKEEGAKK